MDGPTLPVRRGTRAGDDPDVGATFGAWTTVKRIAAGGFGTVFEARKGDERAALKVLHAKFATSAEVLARFEREVHIIQTLEHPAVVKLLDAGFADDGRPFLCMEFLDGQSLSAVIHARGRLPLSDVVTVMAPLCDALATAHERNIVHRDVKASNVMLCGERVVLLDFGIAKISDAFSIELTATNQSLGTPTSMAPEQILGRVIDGRTDVYALGCLAFHMLTGQIPFIDDSSTMLQHLHLHARRPRASEVARVPDGVDDVLVRAMAIDPVVRFADPVALLDALAACTVEHSTALAATTPQSVKRPAIEPPKLTDQAPPRILPTSVPTLKSGMRIAQYELVRELGRGGMGVVHVARDVKLGRNVAMKFLINSSREVAERFLIEARATARCSHDNIVIIHEVDEHEDMPYMVLEYLDGTDLRKVMTSEGKRLPAMRAIELALPIARALARAHELGIIHRDLKPENVFVTTAGQVKVLDFGIAKAIESDPLRTPPLGLDADKMMLTGAGALIGTLPYIAPEQMSDGVDTRSDLWALGIIMFELLAGEHPVQPLTRDTLFANLFDPGPMRSVREVVPDAPAGLVDVIDGCLQKAKAQRIASASEVVRRLEALLPQSASQPRGEPPPASRGTRKRWTKWLIGALVALAVAGVPAVLVLRRSSDRSDAEARRVAELFELAHRGDYVKALPLVEEHITRHPDDVDAIELHLLATWWTFGTLFDHNLEAMTRLPAPQSMLAQGVHMMQQRREREAIAYLEDAQREYPDEVRILYGLGEATWHDGRLDRGVATLERAFELDPRWQMALHHVVEYRLGRGNPRALQPIADRLRTVDPAAAGAIDCRIAIAERRYADAARSIAASGRKDLDAVACQIQATVLRDDFSAADQLLKVASDDRSDLREWGTEAIASEMMLYRGQFDDYLEATRGKPSVQRSLALALWRSSDLGGMRVTGLSTTGMRQSPIAMVAWILNAQRAAQVPDEIYADYPEPEVSAFARGARAELRGDPATAVAEYRKAIATPAKGDVAMLASHHLARVLRQRGDIEGAKAACREVLEPRVYQGYRALLLPDCRLWSEDPKQWKRLLETWSGTFEHPAVIEARKRLN